MAPNTHRACIRDGAIKRLRATVLREREGASQAVFVRHLNVTTSLVSQWERGEKHPQGASLKLLSLVAKHGLGAGRVSQFTPPESSANVKRNRIIAPFILRACRQPSTLAFERAQ